MSETDQARHYAAQALQIAIANSFPIDDPDLPLPDYLNAVDAIANYCAIMVTASMRHITQINNQTP